MPRLVGDRGSLPCVPPPERPSPGRRAWRTNQALPSRAARTRTKRRTKRQGRFVSVYSGLRSRPKLHGPEFGPLTKPALVDRQGCKTEGANAAAPAGPRAGRAAQMRTVRHSRTWEGPRKRLQASLLARSHNPLRFVSLQRKPSPSERTSAAAVARQAPVDPPTYLLTYP